MYYRGSIGVKMLQGGWCLGGIIATPVGRPSRPDSGNSSNSSDTPAHGTIYSAELAYTALLIDMQLAEFPEKRLARRPFGVRHIFPSLLCLPPSAPLLIPVTEQPKY